MHGTFGGYFRQGLIASAAIVCVAAATPAIAQTRSFNVPEQNAASGVATFARQADIQLLISARDAQGRRTNAVRGNFSVENGLQRLLANTGLRAQATGAQTYSVVPISAAVGAAADSESPDAGATPEILVVGQRTQNVDIRRTENDAQPYVVFSSDEIQQSGSFNVEEFLRTRLPMNTQQAGTAQLPGTQANNGQLNLRGLGAEQTLVLVDGRRIGSVADGNGLRQPNINGIPTSAIERIEVLPATSSGIYGGSATGGVVNIILRRNYTGLEATATYGNSFRMDAETATFSVNGGFSLEDGRTNIIFGGSHSWQDALFNSDRTFLRRAQERVTRNNPGAVFLPWARTPNLCSADIFPVSATGFLGSCNELNLVLDNGTALGASTTFVPEGYPGPAADAGAALRAGAGRYNLEAPLRGDTLLSGPSVYSLSLNIRREFTRNLDIFVDLYGDRSRSVSQFGTVQVIGIPADSPNNPFRQDILVSVPIKDFIPAGDAELENLRARAGLIWRIGPRWSASLEHGWSRSRSSTQSFGDAGLSDEGFTFLETIALRDQNAQPMPDLTGLLLVSEGDFGPARLTLNTTSARLSGSPFNLPGGPFTLSGLVERRDEQVGSIFEGILFPPGDPFYLWTPPASQKVMSYYLEGRLPIVSQRNRLPLVRELEVMASVRRDDYDTSSTLGFISVPSPEGPFPTVERNRVSLGSTDYTMGVRYQPVRGLSIRASHGTGFLPPSLPNLVSRTTIRSANGLRLRDPLRGNTPVTGTITLIDRGNPDLRPEESESTSFGMVWESDQLLRGLRLSVDYVDIRKTDEATTVLPQYVIDNAAALAGRVVRGPNLATDPPGWAGPIVRLDRSIINLARSRSRALDIQADYSFSDDRWGAWHLYAIATRQLEFERQFTPQTPLFDSVGFFDGPLAWRGNAGITWERGPWNLGFNTQYFHAYSVRSANPSIPAFIGDQAVLSQGAERIPSQIYTDMFASYSFGTGERVPYLVRGTRISLVIQNVFDKSPPIVASAGTGYSLYGDPRLRRFLLSLRRSF